MATKMCRRPGSRGRKQVSASSIKKLAEMLDQLSRTASLFWQADNDRDIRAAKQRFGKVRAQCRRLGGAAIEDLLRSAKKEGRSTNSTASRRTRRPTFAGSATIIPTPGA